MNLIAGVVASRMSKQTLTDKDRDSFKNDKQIAAVSLAYEAIKKFLPKDIRKKIEKYLEFLSDMVESSSHNTPTEDDYQSAAVPQSYQPAQVAQSALTNIHLLVDTQQLNQLAQDLTLVITNMESVMQEVDAAKVEGSIGVLINHKIRNAYHEITELTEKMRKLRASMDKAAQMYETSEQKIAQLA